MARKKRSPLQHLAEQDSVLAAKKIQEQLQRVLASAEFYATSRQRKFLQFVVTEAVAGRAQEIKAYTIATRVFGRQKNFDQATDPIVSIEAKSLRRALERYYLVGGKQDPVRIDIPRGTYVPTFHKQRRVESDGAVPIGKIPVRFEDSWPSVLIRPFQNMTGDPGLNYLGIGLVMELATELGRYQDIRVSVDRQEEYEKVPAKSVARFAIEGGIRKDREGIKVGVQLIDTANNAQIWSEVHQSGPDVSRLIAFEEEVARVVAVKVAGEHGFISRILSAESRSKPPFELKTYEAILRYHEYELTLTVDSFMKASVPLEHAAKVEPTCGQVWTMLGRLYGSAYSLGFAGFDTSLEKAIAFSEKGVHLNSHDLRARGVLAFVRMLGDEITAARREVEIALALGSNSLFMLDGIGYLMTLLGEWEKGPALIRKVVSLNPFYNPIVHYALWLDCLRQENYEGAYAETMGLRRPGLFWYPLAKAAALGLLGRCEEGKQLVDALLTLKPDFSSRGRILIGHYIKFEELVERVIEGLRRAGLHIE